MFVGKFKKAFGMMAVALSLAVAVTGCGGGTSQSDNNTTGEKAPTETSYKVTHAMGETEIKGTPKNIVVLTNEGTEAVLALGLNQ